ncbi:MAG TPA: helix-turn-helix domain-containing protein [Candidatus Bathyarchaeia archaeon]|nr:helix-turn-helix domain-containing protein [Candidatus Bathyarchaeia archaeon]
MRNEPIYKELLEIRHRLEEIDKKLAARVEPVSIPESKLFSLPNHLRTSYLVVASKGECCAVEVSCSTGKSRAIESSYLNQLVQTGWLRKRKDGKRLMFRVA